MSSEKRASEGRLDERWIRRLRKTSALSLGGVILLACMTLLGWALGLPFLHTINPHGAPMVPNTAVGLIALAIGGTLGMRSDQGAVMWAGRLAAVLALGMGIATLVGYATGLDLGVDRLLDGLISADLPGVVPGRPSIPTAFGFVCLGIAELSMSARSKRLNRWGQLLALGGGFIGMSSLIGHAYGSGALFMVASYLTRGVALHTAIGLLLVALAIVLARPTLGPVRYLVLEGPGGTLARRMGMAALLVPPLLGEIVQLARVLGLSDVPLVFAILVAMFVPAGFVLVAWTAREVVDAHDGIRRSQEAYRALFEQGADGVFLVDREGTYTDVNEQGCSLLRRSREQIIGRRIDELIAPDQIERLWETRQWLMETGGTHRGEWEVRDVDGALIPIEVSTRILSDGRWQGVVRDIRKRKEDERALRDGRERERSLRSRLEDVTMASLAISGALAALREQGIEPLLQTIVQEARRVTSASYSALGLTDPMGVVGAEWVECGTPLRDELLDRRGAGTISAEDGFFLQVPVRHRGRSVGELELAKETETGGFTGDDRRMVEMLAANVGTALETARLYQEEVARRREEVSRRTWLSGILEQLPEGVAVTDGAGRIKLLNRFATRLSVREPGVVDPFGNETIFVLCHPSGEVVPPGEQPLARALRTREQVTETELSLRTETGRSIPVLISAAPIDAGEPGISKEPRGAVLVIQDISTIKELERLRDEWMSVIAHDLRQPVNLIAMTVGMLLERRAPGGIGAGEARALERLRSASARLELMIADLVDVSRIEARQLRLTRGELALDQWVIEAIQRAAHLTQGHVIRLDVEGELPSIDGDPDRLEQVLDNLLSNAAKYGDPDAEIVVRLVPVEEGAEVAVINRGAGISRKDQATLFQRFHRGGQTDQTEGLGLGLYIARGLVEAHGGRIWVDSVPGETTAFRFTVPAFPVRRAAPPEPPSAPAT